MKNTQNENKRIITFLVIIGLLAGGIYTQMILSGDVSGGSGLGPLLQFSPGFSAVITMLIYQRNLKGLGWGWGKTRYQALSWGLPFLLTLVGFGLVWLLGFGGFYNEAHIQQAGAEMGEAFGTTLTSPYAVMGIMMLTNATVGVIFAAIFAVGEEIGWRGFLVAELYKTRSFTQTALISGFIWSVFHYPLLIWSVAPKLGISTWYLILVTTISGVGLSSIMAWLRLKSGSLWTAVLFHAAINIWIQGFFQPLTTQTSELTPYISGEQGLSMALVTAAVAYYFWRRRDELPQS